jgi:hypothetical protein
MAYKHPEEKRVRDREYYLKNREKRLEEKKRRYAENIDGHREKALAAWKRNREKYIPIVRARTLRNRIE